MDQKERLNYAYNYLKLNGKIRSQADLAILMSASQPNISAALNGVPSALTTRFLRRFNEAVGSIFNMDWLLAGVGEMLVHAEPKPVSVPADLLEALYHELHELRREVGTLTRELIDQRNGLEKLQGRLALAEGRLEDVEARSAASRSYSSELSLAAEP